MAEALAALGVVSNILQVIDFGSKLLTTGYGLYESHEGATEQNIHVEELTIDLLALSDRLATAPLNTLAQGSANPQAAHALRYCATKSRDLAKDLITSLQLVKVRHGTPFRAWDALRQSLRSLRKAEKIKQMEQRLEQIKLQMNTHLLAIIHGDIAGIYELVDESRRLHQANIDHLVHFEDRLSSALKEQGNAIKSLKAITKKQAREQQEASLELQAALESQLELQAEERAAAEEELQRTLRENYDRQQENAARHLQMSLEAVSLELHHAAQKARFVSKVNRILQSLLFPEIDMRHDSITEPHSETFRWIFSDHATAFKSWLSSTVAQPFWITGKAGSGKSTLMKFLVHHEETMKLLKGWARGNHLVVANYFFWSSGHTIQRSQEGLLQSIIFQVLRQCPQLVPLACAERWEEEQIAPGSMKPRTWSRSELSATLRAIQDVGVLPVRFCFFIDGLDEYEGDHYRLIADLAGLCNSSSSKICISSRPWNVFHAAYGKQEDRLLVLEDLTRMDLQVYVKNMLEDDPRFKRLQTTTAQASNFADQVRDKADGVFLWVFLAVRSLLRGLTEQDNLDMLRRRLHELPEDLERYFSRMLDGIDRVYQDFTSRALLLAVHANQAVPLSLYGFLQEDARDARVASSATIQTLSVPPLAAFLRSAALAVNTWCRDLLEVKIGRIEVELKAHTPLETLERLRVTFLHRTVKDFLAGRYMQDLLYERAGLSFDPWHTLARLYLIQTKFAGHWAGAGRPNVSTQYVAARFDLRNSMLVYADNVMAAARVVEERSGAACPELVAELDRTCKYWQSRIEQEWCPGRHWSAAYMPNTNKDDEDWQASAEPSFLAYAVGKGLSYWVIDQIIEDPSRTLASPLLDFALRPISSAADRRTANVDRHFRTDKPGQSGPNSLRMHANGSNAFGTIWGPARGGETEPPARPRIDHPDMLKVLLENKVDVNQAFTPPGTSTMMRTVWQQHLAGLLRSGPTLDSLRTTMLCLEHGADILAKITFVVGTSERVTMPASHILRRVYAEVPQMTEYLEKRVPESLVFWMNPFRLVTILIRTLATKDTLTPSISISRQLAERYFISNKPKPKALSSRTSTMKSDTMVELG